MKAAFALLVDHTTHNVMRKLVLDIHHVYGTGFGAAQVPAHITLKQPFEIADISLVEAYFDRFAAGMLPFDIDLTAVEVQSGNRPDGAGIVWLAVRETQHLRDLHDRLNLELTERFAATRAPFDGPDYKFHATVVMGGQPLEVYRRIAEVYHGRAVDLTCHVREIVLCYYDEAWPTPSTFITYKILPLGAA
jgi:2'-5' RNA ligase